MDQPISDHQLEEASSCHLVEADGTTWIVQDVTLGDGGAWVRASRLDVEQGASNRGRPARVFDTSLTGGGRLVWHFPGGGCLVAEGDGSGGLAWRIPGENGETAESIEFYEDDFLNP